MSYDIEKRAYDYLVENIPKRICTNIKINALEYRLEKMLKEGMKINDIRN